MPADPASQGRRQGVSGPGGGRLPAILAAGVSRHTALRTLLRIPLPAARTPHVIGVDGFALASVTATPP